MNALPLAFYESLCAQFDVADCGVFKTLCTENPKYRALKAAIDQLVFVGLRVDGFNGTWSYWMQKTTNPVAWANPANPSLQGFNILFTKRNVQITFDQLKEMDRRHVHVYCVELADRGATSEYHESSFGEILEIMKFTAPCANLADLCVQCSQLTGDVVSRILSFYKNSPFKNIETTALGRSFEEFIESQLSLKRLEKLLLTGHGWSQEFHSQIENYALSSPFPSFRLGELEFSKEFFVRLLKEAVVVNKSLFVAHFLFDFEELEDLERMETIKYLEIASFGKNIVWRREDGVRITATGTPNSFQIEIQLERC